jgi:hypothetical protein
MTVPREELRARYARLPLEELRRIVVSPESQYTPEAREVAASVLADRRFEGPSSAPPSPTPAQRRSAAAWTAASAIAAFVAFFANDLFRAAKEAGVDADLLLRVTKGVVRSPWSYVVVIACAVYVRRRHRG